MAKIIIPTPLRSLTKDQPVFNTNCRSVKEAFKELSIEFPDLARYMINEKGEIRSFIRIFVGEENINVLQDENTSLEEDSIVTIVPAIAGGTR